MAQILLIDDDDLLRNVLREMRVAELPPGRGVDRPEVPLHNPRERHLRPAQDVLAEQEVVFGFVCHLDR